jgi:Ca2+-binding RTX toxin-like protein
MTHLPTKEIHSLLASWANQPDALTDLREIFGASTEKTSPLLTRIRKGDFSWIPAIEILPLEALAPALGAYARETSTIYLSADCPEDQIIGVLLEEIGHHIDTLFNDQETPGDEGALFSAAVRGIPLSDEEITAILNEDDSATLRLQGCEIAIECASTIKKVTTKPTSATLQSAAASVDLGTSSLSAYSGVILTGAIPQVAKGNSQPTNYLQGNQYYNSTLVAGTALATTMLGGAGDNSLDGRANRSNGTLSMVGGSGNTTMLGGSGVATLRGGTGNNSLVAGTGNQYLQGGQSNGSSDTLRGGIGRDTLRAGKGSSSLVSGSTASGSNLLLADGIFSTLVAGAGNDSLSAAAYGGDVTMQGGTGKAFLVGGRGLNSLVSGSSSTLQSNTLIGGSGLNTLAAGSGKDSLVGGSGSNVYLFSKNNILNQHISLARNSSSNILGLNAATSLGIQDADLYNISTLNGGATLGGIVNYGSGNSTLSLGLNAKKLNVQSITGGSGNDSIYVGAIGTNNLSLAGGAGNDTIVADSGSTTLDGGDGNDSLVGGWNKDSLVGGAGDDTLYGGTWGNGDTLIDTLVGGTGNDIYIIDDKNDIIVEDTTASGGTDGVIASITYSLQEGLENLTLKAGSGNTDATGNSAYNYLLGNSGNNQLDGGAGTDTMEGGLGDDVYYIDQIGDHVIDSGGANTVVALGGDVDLSAMTLDGSISLYGGATASYITLSAQSGTDSDENLSTLATRFNDTISGFGGNDTITGADGNDSLLGDNGADPTLDGNDSIDGGAGNDILFGGGGNDTLIGGTGSDTLLGDMGDDYLTGGDGIDSLIGGAGKDTYVIDVKAPDIIVESPLSIGGSGDVVQVNGSFSIAEAGQSSIGNTPPNSYAGIEGLTYLGSTNVSLTGNTLDNTITGGSGNDYLVGGRGSDTMIGGAGNDTYLFEDYADVALELTGGGIDQINASLNDVSLSGDSEVEKIVLLGALAIGAKGNDINNLITGNDADNPLLGMAGSDTLIGNGGNDYLDGGLGADSLVGGAGNDTYILNAVVSSNGAITIEDTLVENANQGTDEIDVAASVDLSKLANFENVLLLDTSVADGLNDFSLTGNALDNIFIGNSGNNLLDGAAGADSMVGGSGNDTYVVDDSGDTVVENVGGGVDGVISSLKRYTLADNVENLQVIGGAGSTGVGNINPNLIVGNYNTNSLVGLGGADTIDAGFGNDTLDGGFDARGYEQTSDSMVGGGGDDYYLVDNGSDVVIESLNGGVDTVELYPTMLAVQYSDQGGPPYTPQNFSINRNNFTTSRGKDYAFSLYLNHTTTLTGGDALELDGGSGIAVIADQDSYYYVLPDNVERLIAKSRAYVVDGGETLIGASSLYGNSLGNYITATSDQTKTPDLVFNDYIDGQGGNDTMAGGLGNDIYVVDSANDIIEEGSGEGTDWVLASTTYDLGVSNTYDKVSKTPLLSEVENLILLESSTSIVNGNPVDSRLSLLDFNGTGNGLNNYIVGNSGNNILDGGDGNDTLLGGTAGNDTILGGTGNDWLLGDTGNDSLLGGDGNDTLDGGTVTIPLLDGNSLVGGAGNDLYIISSFNEIITEDSTTGSGVDTLQLWISPDLDYKYTLADNIEVLQYSGDPSSTGTLEGNTLDNTLIIGSYTGTLDGGIGTDFLSSDTDIDISSESFVSIENILLTGSSDINATGNSLDNTIIGNSLDNFIFGEEGNDSLNGGAGIDFMIGGAGNDTYVVDNAEDIIEEDDESTLTGGIDLVQSSVTYTLSDNVENLILTGSSAINGTGSSLANTITGNSGSNGIDGGEGIDTLIGGAGNDTYSVDNGLDIVAENTGEGTDLVQSSTTYTLSANVENLILTGSSAINGTGNSLANIITGNSGANIIDGGAGNDSLIGADGSDLYVVDNALDRIYETNSLAAGGNDTVQSSVTYALSANVENLVLTGSSAINGTGNSGDNSIFGNSVANNLNGAAGNDTLLGDNGNDTLLGGDGNDYLDGQVGTNSLIGGAGNDTYVINGISDVIIEDTTPSGGIDTALVNFNYALVKGLENLGMLGTQNLVGWGNSGDNSLSGNSGNNTLIGNSGNDTLNGQAGSDNMAGGLGNDFYFVDNIGDVVTENSNQGNDTVSTSVAWTLGNNVENLILTGGSIINGAGNNLSNRLDGSTNSAANSLTGNGGNDTFVVDGLDSAIGNVGTDVVESAFAVTLTNARFTNIENILLTGSGNINAIGTSGNNTISGNSAANSIDGGAGIDSLIGGDGNDTYVVDNALDIISETNSLSAGGIDLVQSSVTYTLSANVEKMILTGVGAINGTGNSLNNTITGNSAANSIDGGAGTDSLIGGAGNDTYVVDSTSDIVTETDSSTLTGGIDLVQSSATYTLSTNVENLSLTGSSAINGTGNSSANTITGNSGNNLLDGGTGIDTLIGGAGNDTLVWDGTDTSLDGGADTDWVSSATAVTLTGAQFTNIENILLTGASNINAVGTSGNNSITGNSANNSIDGGTGNDTMIGGAGDDTYVVDSTSDSVIESISGPAGGVDQVNSSVTFTLGTNIENLSLTGVSNINGTGNELANTMTGNSGNNSLTGNDGRDSLLGLAGNDTLNGGALEDALYGGAGNDAILGGNDNDIVCGTDSTARGANEIDTLTGGSGSDLFILGDNSNAYYMTATNGGDYAYITDFSVVTDGANLQLKNYSSGANAGTVNGYLFGSSNIYGAAIGISNSYLYRDSDNSGTVNTGDNLIAAISATGGAGTNGALTTEDLNKIGFFV